MGRPAKVINPAENCGSCFWWKHEKAKQLCQKSADKFRCDGWSSKEVHRMCANCGKFNTKSCTKNSVDPHALCQKWVAIGSTPETKAVVPVLPSGADVRKMLASGKDPIALGQEMGIELSSMASPLSVKDAQSTILKHHLNTIFTLLPAAELQCRVNPHMNNIYAVTALIEASRAVMDDINNRQDPREMYVRLVKEVIEPMTTRFLEILTNNLSQARSKIRDYVEPHRQGILETTINMTLKDIGGEMQIALAQHLEKLQEMVGVEKGTVE